MNSSKRFLWVGGVVLAAVAILGLTVVLLSREKTPPAQAQTTPVSGPTGYSGISVNGTGTILVKPDVVRLSVGVQLQAPTVTEAQQQAAQKSQAITEALKKAGVKDTDIATADYNIAPNYRYVDKQPPVLEGYNISTQLAVTLREIGKAGQIIDAAGQAGANQIGNISFTLDNNAEALKQARTAAMEDARLKADQLAAGGKVAVGSVISVVEGSQNLPPQVRQFADAPSSGASGLAQARTVIESGQFQVIVNVQVTFGIK